MRPVDPATAPREVPKQEFKPNSTADANPQASFIDEMRSHGFEAPVLPVIDNLERIKAPGDKGRQRAGWYVYREVPDDYNKGSFIGFGSYGSWKGNPDKVSWSSKSRDTMSAAQKSHFDEHIKAAKVARDQALADCQARAAVIAKAIWAEASPAPTLYPYLIAKGIKPHELRVSKDGRLIIPIYDGDEIVSLQYIDASGGKKFLFEGKVKGCYCLIKGNPDKGVVICEGYATGAAIAEAMGCVVLVAFNVGNLSSVAAYAKKQFADKPIVIAGDDDQWTDGNPGRTKAEAIKDVQVTFPTFADVSTHPTDFNDLRSLEGSEALQKQLALAIDQAKPPTFDECMELANALDHDSSHDDINNVLSKIVRLKPDSIAKRKLMTALKSATGIPLGDLKSGFYEIYRENKGGSNDDLANSIAKYVLATHFNNGNHLIRGNDQCFWQFNGTHWATVSDEYIKSILLPAIEADKACDPDDITYNSILNAAFSLLIARQATHAAKLRLQDDPPPVINCKNGELWIKDDGSVNLMPHRFESYLTNVLNVEYQPDAICPKFDQALLDIFQDSTNPKEMARHIMEFMGYAIQPRRNIPAWFMLHGKGRNGKTKFMETIEKLVSSTAIHSGRIGDFEKNRFAIGNLPGKLILLDDDVDTGTKLPDGFIKSVSERKLLTGERKFKNPFEFVATCLPVLLANNLPYTADLTLGIRRRAHLISFNHVFTEADADNHLFPYIWEHELSGVLNRAIEGLLRLQKQGAFDQPQDCMDAQKTWLNSANPVTAFLDECCEINTATYVPIKVLYKALRNWAEECGIKNIPANNTMKSNLEGLGYTIQRRSDTGNAVYGIELIGSYYGKP